MGPRRVSRILSDFIVELELLFTVIIAVVCVCQIKPYADASISTKAQMNEVAACGPLSTRSKTSEKSLMASKISFVGKGLTIAADS